MTSEPRSRALLRLVGRLKQARHAEAFLVQPGDCGWASAPSNIALLKYWGKADPVRQIPVGPSLSRTLGAFRSHTNVLVRGGFLPSLEHRTWPRNHLFALNAADAHAPSAKQTRFIELFCSGWADDVDVEVRSVNNFPTGCGVASSASGYAALVGALTAALGIDRVLGPADTALWLIEWARLGSGSATRSALLLPCAGSADENTAAASSGPFVAWSPEPDVSCAGGGEAPTRTWALDVHPDMRDLEHLLFVLDDREKKVSSSSGHLGAATSLFQTIRVAGLSERFDSLMGALQAGDFGRVCAITEEDALSMHAVMATAQHPVSYLTPQTARVLQLFLEERRIQKWQAMWTLDAGPNVHFLVAPSDRPALESFLGALGPLCGQDVSRAGGVIRAGAGLPTEAGLIMGTGDLPYDA